MQKRMLGQSDLVVSEMGLGCMSLGTNESNANRVIEAALEAGINYFDTADLYEFGENERMVGSALKDIRNQVVIATKVGNRWNEEKNGWSWDPSKAFIKEQAKKSLSRLGTDYIDLYQLHGGTIEDGIEESIEAFEELKAEGLIRFYGISSIRPNVIREYVKKSRIVSVMMQYSILDRRPEETALPLLGENRISVVCRGSLAKGLLTEKNWNDFTTSIKEKGYLDYSSSELRNVLASLKEKIKGDRTLTQLSVQYCLANPVVSSVVVGASTPDQVKKNVNAVNSPKLTEEELDLIKQLTKASVFKDHR